MASVQGPYIYVADSHHHVLGGYALVGLHQPIAMLHLDAHADLGVSGLSWQAQAKAPLLELVSAMDDAGDASIAEWITPLILRRMIESVHWAVPSFMQAPPSDTAAVPAAGTVHDWRASQSINLHRAHHSSSGTGCTHNSEAPPTKLKRGAGPPPTPQDGVLPCTLLSYYLSDGPVVEPPVLPTAATAAASVSVPPASCTIHVGHLASSPPTEALLQGGQPWALDVCLDYFHCRNEHRDIMQRFLSRDELRLATQAWAVEGAILGMTAAAASELVRMHSHVIGSMLAAAQVVPLNDVVAEQAAVCNSGSLQSVLAEHAAHSSPFVSLAAELVLQILSSNGFCIPQKTLLKELNRTGPHDAAEGLPAALAECGPCLDLPHCPAGTDAMAASLQQLQQTLAKAQVAPCLITIACSSEDGFVPAKVAAWLLPRVMSVLQEGLAHVLSGSPSIVCSEHLSADLSSHVQCVA